MKLSNNNFIKMKAIISLLLFVTIAARAQQHEYLRIYQQTWSASVKGRGDINFDFGVKYDSSKVYATLVAPKNLVAAIEFAEDKGWEYVTTFVERSAASSPEYERNIINVLMRRKGEE